MGNADATALSELFPAMCLPTTCKLSTVNYSTSIAVELSQGNITERPLAY
jgi:hypothetical protein